MNGHTGVLLVVHGVHCNRGGMIGVDSRLCVHNRSYQSIWQRSSSIRYVSCFSYFVPALVFYPIRPMYTHCPRPYRNQQIVVILLATMTGSRPTEEGNESYRRRWSCHMSTASCHTSCFTFFRPRSSIPCFSWRLGVALCHPSNLHWETMNLI